MKTTTIIGIGMLAAMFMTTGCTAPPSVDTSAATGSPGVAPRIGVFDSRGVALAYGRSARPDCFLATVGDIRRRHEQAERDGDENRMRALEAEAEALQRRIHEQVFSGTPIPRALALIEDDLPRVAERSGVDLIVGDVLHREPGVPLVDITMHMCAPFEPDADTLTAIEELLATSPVPVSELSHEH